MAEIARKRKEVDDHEAVTKKKYMKQGDLAVSLAKEKEKQKQTGPSSEADHSKEEKEEEQRYVVSKLLIFSLNRGVRF